MQMGQNMQQQQLELDEVRNTTFVLTEEIASMRKNIEDLHISVNEKDAEIIKLRMHLGDEKAKANQRLRADSSRNSLVNQNMIASNIKNRESSKNLSGETSPQPPVKANPYSSNEPTIQVVNQKLVDLEKAYQSKIAEIERNHVLEIKSFKSKLSGSQKDSLERTEQQERQIQSLK